jgi:hypothetical protein
LLVNRSVLISRCAWHPRNYGYAKLLGVARWRGLRLDYTDGICRKCAARVHSDVRRVRVGGGGPGPHGTVQTSEIFVVALAVMTGLMLIARPANEGAVPIEAEDLLPRALTVAEATSDDAPPASTIRAPHRPRTRRVTLVAGRVTPAAQRLTPLGVRVRPVSERLQSP